jgi:hypothetical protein
LVRAGAIDVWTAAGKRLTLRRLAAAEHVILRDELPLFVSSVRSLMPEGFEAALSLVAMADGIAFLAGDPRVPAKQSRAV